jgi:hypothetical protein
LAAVAFWINPKGVFVAAVCFLWYPAGALPMAAGWATVGATAAAGLWGCGALGPYWREVWTWGRIYAGDTFLAQPVRDGILRTLNWAGFHAAALAAAAWLAARTFRQNSWTAHLRWVLWGGISLAGVAAGLRFFPRYYFLLLPVVVLMAARGFALLGRRRGFVALLLIVPLVRFGPTYAKALADAGWQDVAMDRDSRAAAALIREASRPGDTLFVWGYRPEIYAYTRLSAATMFLDSQPLTGVPADRHLSQSTPVETVEARRHRATLAASQPTFVADGLSAYNPRLAIAHYPDLGLWFTQYREVARTPQTVIYRRIAR